MGMLARATTVSQMGWVTWQSRLHKFKSRVGTAYCNELDGLQLIRLTIFGVRFGMQGLYDLY